LRQTWRGYRDRIADRDEARDIRLGEVEGGAIHGSTNFSFVMPDGPNGQIQERGIPE
jgi:hypothetical protein